jgi:hydroxyquinol 1,2-dioxygenase
MRNIDETTITPAVLERLRGCADPRLQQLLGALVRHLHDFAREVRLTEDEWRAGIEFLTATGKMCDDKRQEFILLSDTLGLSMLTVALNHRAPPGVTESTVFGPFFVPGAPQLEADADVGAGAKGELLLVTACVRAPDGRAIGGAWVDVWQADQEGLYDVQRPDLPHPQARARLRTDDQGRLRFRTVLPVSYPIPTDGPVGKMLLATGRHPWRPAHIHFMIEAPGYERLITHVFREDDPYLDSDVVFGVRQSLVASFARHAPGALPDGTRSERPYYSLQYDFVLQPK